jgi:ABC-type nitrate/sulfonate/bicarbonate transport system substrate-binding protein
MRKLWLRAALPLVVLAALAVSACGPAAGASSGPPTNVKLALDWIPNTNHTGIYVALQKGYYRQHGLNVTLVPYGSTYPETLVATGQTQFAISFEESVAIDRAAGQPLVSVAAIIQHDTSALAVLKSSGITRPAQLVGKRFASSGDPAEQAVIDIMEVYDGATKPGYQSTLVSDANVSSLLTGKFDFVWIYEGVEGIQAQDKGVQLTLFNPSDYGVPDFYSPVLITSEQEIKEHPDIVRAFVAATAQGYTYAVQHPQASANLLMQGAQAQGGTLFDSPQVATDSQIFQSAHYIADAKCWGVQSLQTWTDFPRLLYHYGALVDANGKPLTTEPDYSAMFTNAYLPAC